MSEKRRGWTQEEIQFVKENYGKLSLHALSSRMSRSYESISSKIYKLKLDDPRCWTEKEDDLLIANYEYNPTVWNLFPERSRAAIIARARKYKLNRHCGNYPVNFKFFDTFNERSAYVLGFFIADGCVEPKLNRFSFSQRTEDVDVLYKIREAMECENPLCFKKTRNEVSLYIHNRYMVDKLVSMGFDNKKTYSASIPEIPKKYMKHLIRGLLDGDGSVYIDSNNRTRIQFLGTYNVLQTVKNYLISIGCSNTKISKRKVHVHSLHFGSRKDIELIIKDLYLSSSIYMDRKYQKAIEIMKLLRAFARGVIPRRIDPAQNGERFPGNAAPNPVGKTSSEGLDWPVEDTRWAPTTAVG